MALVLADRVRDTTTTTGTGTVTLSGTAPTGYQTFGAAIGNGNTTYYTINAGSQWEVGLGTYSSTGPTLARTTVLASSNGGSLVDFSTGTKDVFVTYPAEKSVNYDASGNVGIGTTSPGVKLDVTGNVRVSYSSAGNASLVTNNTSTASGSTSQLIATNDASRSLRIQYSSSGGIGGSQLTGGFSGETAQIFTDGNYPISIGTNTTARLNIDTSGNVGIGVASPAERLDVNGNAKITSGSSFYWGDATSQITATNGGAMRFLVGNGGEKVRIDSSGNVGIGTSTPGYKLDVAGTVNTSQALRFSASHFEGGATYSISNYLTNMVFNVPTGSGFGWAINGGDTMLINSSGNVGIGTSSPGSKLHLSGAAAGGAIQETITNTDATGFTGFSFTDGTNTKGQIWVGNGSYGSFGGAGSINYSANSGPHVWYTNYSERMRIDSSGSVGIGTSSPGSKLDVRGVITGGDGTIQTVISYLASAGVTGTLTNHPYVFYANNAERARFTTDGRFFIGATSGVGNDQMLVAFNSSTAVTQAINMRDNNASGNGNSFLVLRRSDDTYLGALGRSGTDTAMFVDGNSYLTLRTGGTERMRIDSSGNVGIGVSNPGAYGNRLGVGSPSDTSTNRIGILTQYGTATLVADGATAAAGGQLDVSWANGGQGPLRFTLTNSEKMRIGANGAVAIGGTGTDASLHIQQAYGGYDRLTQMSPNSASKNAFNLMAARNSSNADLWWSWGVRNDSVWALQEGVNYSLNGSLGFYYDSGGQAYKSGGGSWASTSDIRVKTNIVPISDAASRIMALKPSSFDYRVPEAHAGRVADRGFIAQDFEEVYPHSVSKSAMVADAEKAFVTGDDKIKAISLNNDFFADLVALVQEQHEIINDLRARVAQLEGN